MEDATKAPFICDELWTSYSQGLAKRVETLHAMALSKKLTEEDVAPRVDEITEEFDTKFAERLAKGMCPNGVLTFSHKVWQSIDVTSRRRLFHTYNIHILAPATTDGYLPLSDIKDWDSVDAIDRFIGIHEPRHVHSK